MSPSSRDDLRRQLRAERQALPLRERERLARLVARQVIASPMFRSSHHIAAYIPCRGEVDPTPILHEARQRGKRIYLPVLSRLHARRMWFVEWTPETRFVNNRFGIPEPRGTRNGRGHTHIARLDLVLTPLVAFDRHGHRIGMGGGYYDTSFAQLNHRLAWRKPRLLGLAYAFQEAGQIEHHPWDVHLDAIATEKQLIVP